MTTVDKREHIKALKSHPTPSEEAYYQLLYDIDDLKTDYRVYMTTAPVNCDEELKRLPNADYDLCCAFLTMLLREDHFCNGSFEKRYHDGQVEPILDRMIELLGKK